MDKNIIDMLDRYDITDEKIYTYPDIPRDKAKNAIDKYAQSISYEDILVLVDDTVFGSATDGMIVTQDFIFCHELWTDPVIVDIDDIESVDYRKKQLIINDSKIYKSNIPEASEIAMVYEFISDLANYINCDDSKEDDENDDEDTPSKENSNRTFAKLGELCEELNKKVSIDLAKLGYDFKESLSESVNQNKPQILENATTDGIRIGIILSCIILLTKTKTFIKFGKEDYLDEAYNNYKLAKYIYENKMEVNNTYRSLYRLKKEENLVDAEFII